MRHSLLASSPEDGAVRPDGADHVPVVGERHGPLEPGWHLGEETHQRVGAAALVVHPAKKIVILTTHESKFRFSLSLSTYRSEQLGQRQRSEDIEVSFGGDGAEGQC